MGEAVGAVGAAGQAAGWTLDAAYRAYRAPIERYLTRMCGSADLAEELAQETFLRAVVGWLRFRGECSVASWLFRIAHNTYVSYLRRPHAVRIDTDEFLAIPDSGITHDPVHRHDSSERLSVIQLALAQLPEKQRSILLLRDDEGLAYAEIAEVQGISLAAVKVNLFRARNAFRVAYAAFEENV